MTLPTAELTEQPIKKLWVYRCKIMFKVFLLFSLLVLLFSCSNNTEKTTNDDTVRSADMSAATRQSEVDTNVNDIGTNRASGKSPSGAFEKGRQLISQSDCLACHQETTKSIGPSYIEVARKYEKTDANISYLITKVIKGGTGVWGDIPMTPHPNMTNDDAREMVNYILSLKQ